MGKLAVWALVYVGFVLVIGWLAIRSVQLADREDALRDRLRREHPEWMEKDQHERA